MHTDQPCRTAQRVAERRAVHQLFDDPKIIDDPYAVRIVGAQAAARLRAEGGAPHNHSFSRALRAFLVARSRLAEDELALAVQNGVRQYVILGAGLDTFAFRNTHSDLKVFEVDHPATQSWKRARLDEVGLMVPESLSFAPVDFERQTIADGLRQAGFRTADRSFVSWLGVVPYLNRDALMATFQFVVSSMPGGSAIVFDYPIPPEMLHPEQRSVFELLAERVSAAGEPWRTFFDPASLARDLKDMGFAVAEDVGAEELNRRYFRDRRDGLKVVGTLGRMMLARV